MDLHHPILREFPEHREIIKRLKGSDDHFRTMFDEYHRLDDAVYRIEEKYSDAAHSFLGALDVRESLRGQGDVSLLPILNDLGRLYLEVGDSRQAENMLMRAMAIVEAQRAEESTDGADTLNNLAVA